ncbi:MAG TPA: hypothetical protein VHO23_00815 [Candidatus Paceibacterota bacterium]|nr:hypothetical protein [Candidatus Paceibacterota bacterium]
MNKNLNDIIPPSRRRTMAGETGGTTLTPDLPPPPQMSPRAPKPPKLPSAPRFNRGGRGGFPIGTAIVALLVIAGSVGALFAFSGAKVTVTPMKNQVAVTSTYEATRGTGDLPFDVITLEKTGTASIDAEGTENVTQAAQGTIVISNQQDAPQALIKNTRFETPDGLVFRIRDSITVPAAKNGAPGTLSVTVYADVAGESHNVGPSTFTLPGLAGTPTFDLVTARSTDSMRGGFSGARPTVSEGTKDAEYARLQSTLDDQLKTDIAAQVPAGYVLVPGSTLSTFEEQPDTAGAGNTVELSIKGAIRAVIFPEEALAKKIAFETVGTYAGEPLRFASLDTLSLAPAEGLLPNEGEESFSFTLTGNANLVWKVDAAKIAGAVAGKTRDAAQLQLESLPEVGRALIVLKPFWKSSFPDEPEKVTVEVEGETGTR